MSLVSHLKSTTKRAIVVGVMPALFNFPAADAVIKSSNFHFAVWSTDRPAS